MSPVAECRCWSFRHHRAEHVTSKSPVGDISVVTLIRTDTTRDHSLKAEKVTETHFSFPYAAVVKPLCGALVGQALSPGV